MNGKSSEFKIVKFTVREDNYFRRIDKFLRRSLSNLSLGRIYFLLRKGKVKINGRRITKPSHELKLGDEITLKMPEDFLLGKRKTDGEILIPRRMDLKIVYEDNHIIVISKPSGIPIHPGKRIYGPTLIEGLLYHGNERNFKPFLVHRLDKHTSGILLIAKNRETARILGKMLKERKIHKEYVALVKGEIKENGRISIDLDDQSAETVYKPVKVFQKDSVSLIRVWIKTGRKHQIRRHMAYIGHPVVGDDVYGDRQFNRYFKKNYNLRRYFLHAFKMSFVHPITNKLLHFESPLSDDLKRVISKLESY